MTRRSTGSLAAVLGLLATAIGTSIAVAAGPATNADTPGLAPVPPGPTAYLAAPAAQPGGTPPLHDKPGPSMVSCKAWPGGIYTQTHDPLSPTCVSTWDFAKGNGGSTAPGVDDNVIRIGASSITPELRGLVRFFNANYQFYGRSLQLVDMGAPNTLPKQNAALAAAAQARLFAAADIDGGGGIPADADAFVQGLAKRGIVGVVGDGLRKDASLSTSGPYGWSAMPTQQGAFRALADMACSTLKGRPARLLDPVPAGPRRFAVLSSAGTRDPATAVDADYLVSRLGACGIKATSYRYQDAGFGDTPALLARDLAMFAQMKRDGITTILYTPSSEANRNEEVFPEAAQAGLDAEWVLAPSSPRDINAVRTPGQAQATVNLMGGVDLNAAFDPHARAAMLAGGADPSPEAQWRGRPYEYWYSSLSIIAAGVQAAGPNLTPRSFAAGLESLNYPQPGVDTLPSLLPHVGFRNGDHVFIRDYGLGRYDGDKRVPFDNGMTSPFGWCPAPHRYGYTTPWPTNDDVLVDKRASC